MGMIEPQDTAAVLERWRAALAEEQDLAVEHFRPLRRRLETAGLENLTPAQRASFDRHVQLFGEENQ